ncbi:hypothetical protein D3C72_2327740 [compost metagenome]
MYAVILLFLIFVSFCGLAIGFVVERYLGKTNKKWRILGYSFGIFSLAVTAILGLLVSLAFSSGTLAGYSAVVLYGVSIVFIVASLLHFKNEQFEKL